MAESLESGAREGPLDARGASFRACFRADLHAGKEETLCEKDPISRLQEDRKIMDLVEEHGPSRWSVIAQDLPGRIGKQCRER